MGTSCVLSLWLGRRTLYGPILTRQASLRRCPRLWWRTCRINASHRHGSIAQFGAADRKTERIALIFGPSRTVVCEEHWSLAQCGFQQVAEWQLMVISVIAALVVDGPSLRRRRSLCVASLPLGVQLSSRALGHIRGPMPAMRSAASLCVQHRPPRGEWPVRLCRQHWQWAGGLAVARGAALGHGDAQVTPREPLVPRRRATRGWRSGGRGSPKLGVGLGWPRRRRAGGGGTRRQVEDRAVYCRRGGGVGLLSRKELRTCYQSTSWAPASAHHLR